MQKPLSLDFVLSFCRDKIPGHGEDSYCYSFCDTAGMVGTFDGCGGAGARTHAYYSGHTEAYMASRLCAGAFYDGFRELFPSSKPAEEIANEVFAPKVISWLQGFEPPKGGLQIKGSSVRTLPTTAAVALIQPGGKGQTLVTAIWAGDSRVYLMDKTGLAQLTVDDTTVTDPMENIYDDGILQNLFCSDKPVKLHCKTVSVAEPFVVFSATDGCFGYLSTPMEFEGVLLNTLMRADSAAQWEKDIANVLGGVAGDDHTLCLAACGYGSFDKLKKAFASRQAAVAEAYLMPIERLPVEDRESRYALWQQYKENYIRYIKDGLA